MIKNLLIARKTYRFMETVGMFMILKNVNDRFRLALIKLLTPEKKFHDIPPFKRFFFLALTAW